jgi:hypothetical protein
MFEGRRLQGRWPLPMRTGRERERGGQVCTGKERERGGRGAGARGCDDVRVGPASVSGRRMDEVVDVLVDHET